MKRTEHTIDASGKTLGRLASEVALLLRGKNNPSFERHIDGGDSVTVFNLDGIKITGTLKAEQKEYYRHSGYPGGLKRTTLATFLEKDPGKAFSFAVFGMLPKNKLRPMMMKRLKTYRGEIK